MDVQVTNDFDEKPTLSGINDDILIHILSFATIEDILAMRQVSRRMCTVSKLRIVWQRALYTHVLAHGFPFPNLDANTDLNVAALEARTRRAYALGRFWKHSATGGRAREACAFAAGSNATGVAQVYFVPARPGYVVALAKGIWSVINCWDVGTGDGDGGGGVGKSRRARPVRVAEWAPQRTLITALAVNGDPRADACLAVSVTHAGTNARAIQIMKIDTDSGQFSVLQTIDTPFKAMTLRGDILAASDDLNETHIIHWRTGDYAVMWGSDEPSEYNFQHNQCLQVMFAPRCIFVVRARSLEMFPQTILRPKIEVTSAEYVHPMGCHRFGWIDGISMSVQKLVASSEHSREADDNTRLPPLSILLRAESDDPWASDVHTLDLFVLNPNPDFRATTTASATHVSIDSCERPDLGPGDNPTALSPSPRQSPEDTHAVHAPYVFPPVRAASWASTRGHLRCRDILVGPCGTALWIQPRPAHNVGLTALDVHSSLAQGSGAGASVMGLAGTNAGEEKQEERVVAALLPGLLRDTCVGQGRGSGEVEDGVRTLYTYGGAYGMWRCLDYDEARGRLALGDSLGQVVILELGRADADSDLDANVGS